MARPARQEPSGQPRGSEQFLLNVIPAKCKSISPLWEIELWICMPCLLYVCLQVNKTALGQPWLDPEQSTPGGELESGNKFGAFRWAS